MIFRTQGHRNIPSIIYKKTPYSFTMKNENRWRTAPTYQMKSPSPVKGKKPAKKVLPPTGKCRNI